MESCLTQCQLQAITKVKETVIKDFLFTEDCALNTTSEQKMQTCVNGFSAACNNFGLIISTKQTEVVYQPGPGKTYQKPNITDLKRTMLNDVDRFTDLGSILSCQANIAKGVVELPKQAVLLGSSKPTSGNTASA